MGYDFESRDSDVIRLACEKVYKHHTDMEIPATIFLVGQTLLKGLKFIEVFLEQPDLFDIQQHTYSHVLFKTVVMDDGVSVKLVPGGSLDRIKWEVVFTRELLGELLGVKCVGVRGPYGYYRGLMDRPDVLQVLHEAGIRFTSTWGRNHKDWHPIPIEVQPFWYDLQGFPGILEIPFQF